MQHRKRPSQVCEIGISSITKFRSNIACLDLSVLLTAECSALISQAEKNRCEKHDLCSQCVKAKSRLSST